VVHNFTKRRGDLPNISSTKTEFQREIWVAVIKSKAGARLFWTIHYMTAPYNKFYEDYLEAWNQQAWDQRGGGEVDVDISSEGEHRVMRISKYWDDARVVNCLNVHYGIFRAGKHLAAIFSPKHLTSIAAVEVSLQFILEFDLIEDA
jgi:hypothetical protein